MWENITWGNSWVVVGWKNCRQTHSKNIGKTVQLTGRRKFPKHSSSINPNNFWYQTFVPVCRNLGEKVPVCDDMLPSHEHEIYLTTSLNENRIEFEFQTDRNYYLNLKQTYLALKEKLMKGLGNEIYNTKQKTYKEETKKRQRQGKYKKRRRTLQFLRVLTQPLFALISYKSWGVRQQPANLRV